jgi:two-component system sensor histidine kinase DegS
MMMESLAGQAAVALSNNLLYKEMNNLLKLYKSQNEELEYLSTRILEAHEQERKRIARDIHDGPAQSVANLCFKLEVCKKYFESENFDKFSFEYGELYKNVRSTVKEIRSIIYDLKPSCLEDGLIKALQNYLNMLNENSDIEHKFNVSGDDSVIEYYLASTIYRIVQEALSNILKYANARKVTIGLIISSKDLSLSIVDDGKGFDTSGIEEKKPHKLEGGFGIEGMIVRVKIVRGKIGIESSTGTGTKITVKIPLNGNSI